jgi:hypothetical protein
VRIQLISILVVFVLACLQVRAAESGAAPATICEDQSKALPDFYYEAVLARIKPPGSQDWLLSITLNGENKLVLGTTGDQFQLWTDTPDLEQKTIHQFLRDLAASCRLPYNPADAAALVKVKWEVKELSATQFSQIHVDFTQAASGYVSKAQDRYGSLLKAKMLSVYLDASFLGIIYDNRHEHFELQVLDDGDKIVDPMVKWGHDVLKLAEESFHRPFGRRSTN